jgi:hypothetical protein
MGVEVIESFRFTPEALRLADRRPGISAFMRVRDGAFSLEAAVRSHIGHFDEIVVVHNRCTDRTPEILARLEQELAPRLRVYHYLPDVFPPGSAGHRTTPPDAPGSLVNYYNLSLSLTRFSHATKLDDDHVAMGEATAGLVADVRAGRTANGEMACFSGLNLARDAEGDLGVFASEPFSGSGDIGIFPVGPTTVFSHDRRFEAFRPELRRRFHSFVYWHLKYLKPDLGFANYDLASNPDSRYARRLRRLEAGLEVVDLPELAERTNPRRRFWQRLTLAGLPVPERMRLLAERAAGFGQDLGQTPLAERARRDAELAPFIAGEPD